MSEFEKKQRQLNRISMVFNACVMVRDSLGGSAGKLEERMEHVRVAAVGAECAARAVMVALLAKGIITEEEQQDFLDMGCRSVLDQITAAVAASNSVIGVDARGH
jgi:hypothetical protein